jgi:hypothetical protein
MGINSAPNPNPMMAILIFFLLMTLKIQSEISPRKHHLKDAISP